MPVSILPFDPNPDGTCRACRGAVHPETWLCTRCGAAHGERNRCPHCRTIARTLPHPTLYHRCSVCGKPRLPPGPSATAATDATAIQLRSAGQSHRIGTALAMVGYGMLALGLPGLLLTAVVLLILMPGAWVSGIALFFALLPLLFWLFLRNRARHATTDRNQAIERAYSQAILDTLRAGSIERSAEGIAELIGLPLDRTEKLLMSLNANDHMSSRVTDDGELLFGVAEPPRVRIADYAAEPMPEIVDAEFATAETVDSHALQKK